MSTKRQPPSWDPEKHKRQRTIDEDDNDEEWDDESDTLGEESPSPSTDNQPSSIKKPIAVTSVENLTISELLHKLDEYKEIESHILGYQQLLAMQRQDVFKALSTKCNQKGNDLERWKEIARRFYQILKRSKEGFEKMLEENPGLDWGDENSG